MERMGICFKCGLLKLVRDHHWKGYSEEFKDDVKPFCRLCDIRDHKEGLIDGRFKLLEDSNKLSTYSWIRRFRDHNRESYNKSQIKYLNYPS